MNRLDFLHQLYLALDGIPDPPRRSLLAEYEAHFDLAAQQGKTEEEVAAALGDPWRLAQAIREKVQSGTVPPVWPTPPQAWSPPQSGTTQNGSRRQPGRVLLGVGLLVLAGVLIVSTSLGRTAGKSGKGLLGTLEQAMPGETHQVDEHAGAAVAAYNRITVHTSSPDIHFVLTDSEEVTAALQGSVTTTTPQAVPTLLMETEEGALTFRVIQKSASIGIFISDLTLTVSLPASWEGALSVNGSSADISLPDGNLASLEVRSVSGDVTLGTLSLRDQLVVETSSGEVALERVKAASASVKTVSGDCRLQSMTCIGDIVLETSSGILEVPQATAESLKLSAVSGDMLLGDITVNSLEMDGSSSHARVENGTGATRVKTVSGDVEIGLRSLDRALRVETSSGSVQIAFPDNADMKVDATSSSGMMEGSLNLSGESKKEHAWSGTLGNGTATVSITTVSGDVTLNR